MAGDDVSWDRRSLVQTTLAKKRNQFVHTEIREHLAMPIHSRCFCLTGKGDHVAHRLRVAGNNHCLDLNALAMQELDDLVTPRATGLDIKDGLTHGRSITCFRQPPSIG